MWGFADAQEFSGVSPEMFEEFAIMNQKIGLNLFGFGCYGCCEPLDGKYDAIYRNITNVRRLSVSPWSDIPMAVENIGQKAIFSWKPDPARICTGFDEDEIFRWLKDVAHRGRTAVSITLHAGSAENPGCRKRADYYGTAIRCSASSRGTFCEGTVYSYRDRDAGGSRRNYQVCGEKQQGINHALHNPASCAIVNAAYL